MNCPVCKEPMIVLEHESIEVDYCVSCQGIWLDAGEIELLLGDAVWSGFLESGDLSRARGEARRRCPICRTKMDKAVTTGPSPVVYDRCPRGDGLWFDKDELAAVLANAPEARGGEKIAAFLRDVFPRDAAPGLERERRSER